jgi:hypothetical protein
VDSPRSDRHYRAVERGVRTLPGIRHIIRLLVFVFYDIRFIDRYNAMKVAKGSWIDSLVAHPGRTAIISQR